MITLKDILHGIPVIQIIGALDKPIQRVCFDSREISTDCLFVAVKGTRVNGNNFIPDAVSAGATAIICEEIPATPVETVTYVIVVNPSFALGVAAANFFGNPSSKLRLVGVTGTNGKTTVATLLYNLFTELGYAAGLVSTVGYRVASKTLSATHTTPDPVQLNALFRQMVDEGCDYCFMEVSSHAVIQDRIAGLVFAGGVFTNISHDHLDYHGTFDNYIEAKQRFFDGLGRSAFALYNQDDRNGNIMVQNTFAHKKSYALKNIADFKAKILETHFDGTLLQIEGQEVWVGLVGEFNAYNLLSVYGTAILLEQETMKVLTAMSRIEGAQGRFEVVLSPHGVIGIVDYAHTPDAVKNVLDAISKIKKGDEQIIAVLGCGGDRDKLKRPAMANIAVRNSDKLIITSDNPRTEDPAAIIRDMESGIDQADRKRVFSIADRKEAIRAACHLAQPGDVVLVAGKGHETYQEINGERFPFDDKSILTETFHEQ